MAQKKVVSVLDLELGGMVKVMGKSVARRKKWFKAHVTAIGSQQDKITVEYDKKRSDGTSQTEDVCLWRVKQLE
tara:strand:+ start:516 stop:737 length:222 start_codon:yes stop_codon:yes gene_type:complete